MKIEILNSNPTSIKTLLEYIENNLPSNITFGPLTIDFGLYDISQDEDSLDVTLYDFFDSENKIASTFIEDANLLFDDVTLESNELEINGDSFSLRKIERSSNVSAT